MTEGLPDPALLATMEPEAIRALLDSIPEAHLAVLAESTAQSEGVPVADLLPHQIPPAEGWDGWMLMAGRGAGKTFTASNFLGGLASSTPGLRGRIIAPTLADAVNSVVLDPQSGLLAHHPTARLMTSGPEGTRVVFPNKATIWCVGTPTLKDVDRLRALTNIDVDLYEEAAANPMLKEAVAQANLSRRGNRLPKPIWVAMTTPRPTEQILAWKHQSEDVLGEGELVVLAHATMFDNPHTHEAYREHARALEGTRAYRQEVLGEVLEDVEGALWTMKDIERSYWNAEAWGDVRRAMTKVVVGVDPAGGSGTTGIIVAGKDAGGKVWVLADYSMADAQPGEWARQVARASEEWGGALVVAEKNQGQRMVEAVLKAAKVSLPVKNVWAADGKRTRAEPIAVLWEADTQIAGMVPGLGELETQLCEWVPDVSASPDRLDAMVWACSYLLDKQGEWKVVGRVLGSGQGRTAGGRSVGKVAWG